MKSACFLVRPLVLRIGTSVTSFVKKYPLVVFLTVFGAVLRLYNIRGTLIFLGDQGRDASVVRNLLVHFDPILIGPTTSVGKIQLGPLYYYFMAPWLAVFNFDPVGPAIGVALLGIITIPVLYFVVRQMFTPIAATVTTILYTFSNLIIVQTRSSWNPNPMPLVIVLLVWSLWKAYEQKKYGYVILSWILWGVALQLHYMALLLGPMIAGVWLLVWLEAKNSKGVVLKNWLLGVGAFLMLALPLLIFDLRHNFINAQGFLEFFQKGNHSPKAWYQPVIDMEGRMYQAIGQILGFESLPAVRNPLSWVVSLSFIVFAWLKRSNKAYQLMLLYFLSSLIGLSLYTGDVFEHYLSFVFPLPFIIVGVILSLLWNQRFILGKVITVGCVATLLYVYSTQYRINHSLGWQIDDVKRVSEIIAEDAGQKAYNVVLLDDTKDYRAMNYRYFLEISGTRIVSSDNYASPDVLYIIAVNPDLNSPEIETREIETFLGKRVRDMQAGENSSYLSKKVTRQWQFSGGPWVYRIER